MIAVSETIDVRNPRTGEIDYQIPVAGSKEIAAVASSLRVSQKVWRDAGVASRIETMTRWKTALQNNQDAIIEALELDTGRKKIVQGEFFGLIGLIDKWSALAPSLTDEPVGNSVVMPDVEITHQLDPYPLLGAISPWNFPLLLSFIDAVPALLAGCAAIIKPSEVTPRFAAAVSDTIAEVPELHAVLRFVSGDGRTGAALVEQVDVVAFTGSVATGKKVALAAAKAFIPAFLELGGKDPVVLLEDSPLERASTAILRASVAATGQACQSLERVYVNADQHDDFVNLLTEKARATETSYPDPDKGIVGPLIFDEQAEIIGRHVEDAVQKGAIIRCGGEVMDHGGSKWIAPTVLSNVNHDMLVMTEETFGPVMPVMRFDTQADAIALANDSRYGLSGAVFAGDENQALAFARQMNVGGVSVNDAGMTTMIHEAPKSAFKLSGMGPSRMGPSGLTRFLRHKAVYHNHGAVVPIETMAEG